MITKIHSSILHIDGLVGEKEAAKSLTDLQKAKKMVCGPAGEDTS